MRKFLIIIFLVILVSLSAYLASLPLPLQTKSSPYTGLFLSIVICIFIICFFLSRRIAHFFKGYKLFIFSAGLLILLITTLILNLQSIYLSGISLLTISLAWGIFFFQGSKISGSGVVSLFLTLCTILTLEYSLRSIPNNVLLKSVSNVPKLAPVDRGNQVFEKNGYRGKRPCQDCPKDLLRIVTMGGSSTYGVPMFYSRYAYAEVLGKLLKERLPDKNFEVLNGGIPGYGITQIIDSLKEVVIKDKPQIVTICAWFNDSSNIPNWYSLGNSSDIEGYKQAKLLEFIENLPGYSTIHRSKLYGVFRYYIISLRQRFQGNNKPKGDSKKSRKRPRMTPEEFRWGLEEVVKLGKENNFIPVFIYEPLNRTGKLQSNIKGYKYYSAVKEIAEKNGLPLVDTLSVFSEHREEWLFYDFIHPNARGHELIAEAIYDTLKHVKKEPFYTWFK